MSASTLNQTIQVFISYALEDGSLLTRLQTHLALLRRQGHINAWSSEELGAGVERADEIRKRISSADVILLLISADSINSDYLWGTELQRAVQRHENGEAVVIPILLKPLDDAWKEAPFGKLQPLPKNGNPVTKWIDQEEAFSSIAQGIREVTTRLLLLRYQKRLQEYKQLLIGKTETDYPFTEETRNALNQYYLELGLKDEDVLAIEKPILDRKRVEYDEKMVEYQRLASMFLEEGYPPSDATKERLRQEQKRLGLRKEDAKSIVAPIYRNKQTQFDVKRNEYEKLFLQEVEKEYPINEITRGLLKRKQHELGLKQQAVNEIEKPIIDRKEKDYQNKLFQYQQTFHSIVKVHNPPNPQQREQLKQLKSYLNLQESDVIRIEAEVLSQTPLSLYLNVIKTKIIPSVIANKLIVKVVGSVAALSFLGFILMNSSGGNQTPQQDAPSRETRVIPEITQPREPLTQEQAIQIVQGWLDAKNVAYSRDSIENPEQARDLVEQFLTEERLTIAKTTIEQLSANKHRGNGHFYVFNYSRISTIESFSNQSPSTPSLKVGVVEDFVICDSNNQRIERRDDRNNPKITNDVWTFWFKRTDDGWRIFKADQNTPASSEPGTARCQ